MAKIHDEMSILKLRGKGKVDADVFQKPKPKPVSVPPVPSKEEKMVTALLAHVKELVTSSESTAEANRKFMAYMMDKLKSLSISINSKDNNPKKWSFDIVRATPSGPISKVNATAE